MALTPTDEQNVSIELSKIHRVVKIEAGAGCGKSSTLALIAKENPEPSLYLAFNKALADEAKEKFPNWVMCRTTHSLAYASFGSAIQSKLKRPMGAYQNVCGTGAEIARYYRIIVGKFCDDQDKVITAAGMGIAVKETVNRFEQSAEFQMETKHVSFTPAAHLFKDTTFNKTLYAMTVLSYAQLLWKERKNPASAILATHDTYLKLYQLSKPSLSQYATIYLDESQDSNDCVIDIVRRQKDSKIILVGDDAQTLYAWRGSVNAMEKFDGAVSQLTTSFRFGPKVAAVAKAILNLKLKGGLDLKGHDPIESEVLPFLPPEHKDKPRCQLYRMNSTLISEGVSYILAGKKVSLEIDVRDFINMLNSVVALQIGDIKGVKHEEVIPYPSWKALGDEIEFIGGDLARVYRLVASGRAEEVLGALADYKKPANPDLILTTGHKSKGREFDIVVLANDFPSVYNSEGEWIGLEDGEANLLYVGSTRARKLLVYNQTVADILEKSRKGGVDICNVQLYDSEYKLQNALDCKLIGEVSQMAHFEEELETAVEDGLDLTGEFGDSMAELGIMNMPELDKQGMKHFSIMPNTDLVF